jgi:hypothetical protein
VGRRSDQGRSPETCRSAPVLRERSGPPTTLAKAAASHEGPGDRRLRPRPACEARRRGRSKTGSRRSKSRPK